MRQLARISVFVCVIAVFCSVGLADVAGAESYSVVRPGGRGGTWEFLLPLKYTDSAAINGAGGSRVDISSDWGLGFGFGYNINDHFQLNGIFDWSYRSYQATIVQDNGQTRYYNNYVDTSTMTLNGIYYLMSGDFTPFVSGGIGIGFVDTNIPTSPAQSVCYWDPWWGYVCGGYQPTKTESDVVYNAGAGVRFDVNRQFSLQGSYNKSWMNVSRAQGIPDFDIWRLDFIFRM